jgi:secondary thiamine-phosphate synthase enzyme
MTLLLTADAVISQEPTNAHSHLLSMILGNSLAVPVAGGVLQLGTWQSIILVELDGPRTRTVGLQVMGL